MKGALPNWIARDESDARAMHRWVNARLDEAEAAERQRLVGDADLDAPWSPRFHDPLPELSPEQAAERAAAWGRWIGEGGFEREAAKHGVIGLARERVRRDSPLLVDLVRLPPLRPGEKYLRTGGMSPTDRRQDGEQRFLALPEAIRSGHVAAAARDVPRIRALWQKPPPSGYGRKNRHHSDGPSAVEIAAERQTRLINRTYGPRSPVGAISPEEVEEHLRNPRK